MSVEIRRLTVRSVIQRAPDEAGPLALEDEGPDLGAFREEILEACRRMVADARRNQEER